jgi:hypothetical protein
VIVDKEEALREAEGLGHSYFYDFLDEQTDEQILTEIQEHIRGTRLPGLIYWEQRRDALRIVLAECSDEELDDVLWNFGHVPEEVGGNRQFLNRIHEVITKAIEERKPQ